MASSVVSTSAAVNNNNNINNSTAAAAMATPALPSSTSTPLATPIATSAIPSLSSDITLASPVNGGKGKKSGHISTISGTISIGVADTTASSQANERKTTPSGNMSASGSMTYDASITNGGNHGTGSVLGSPKATSSTNSSSVSSTSTSFSQTKRPAPVPSPIPSPAVSVSSATKATTSPSSLTNSGKAIAASNGSVEGKRTDGSSSSTSSMMAPPHALDADREEGEPEDTGNGDYVDGDQHQPYDDQHDHDDDGDHTNHIPSSEQKQRTILKEGEMPSSCVWVGNVSPNLSHEEFQKAFEVYGEVILVRMFPASKCAFVTFKDRAAALKSLALEGKSLGDMNLTLNIGKASKHLWVGNINDLVTDSDLLTVFSVYGEIESVRVLKANQQCAFVNFVHDADAVRAAEVLNGTELGGQRIVINFQWEDNFKRGDRKNRHNNNNNGGSTMNHNLNARRDHRHIVGANNGGNILDRHHHVNIHGAHHQQQAALAAAAAAASLSGASHSRERHDQPSIHHHSHIAAVTAAANPAGIATVTPTSPTAIGGTSGISPSLVVGAHNHGRDTPLSTSSLSSSSSSNQSQHHTHTGHGHHRTSSSSMATNNNGAIDAAALASIQHAAAAAAATYGSPAAAAAIYQNAAAAATYSAATRQYMDPSANRGYQTPSRQLFVGNLIGSVSEETLVALFSRFGEVETIKSFANRGYAFVVYTSIRVSIYVREQMNLYPPFLGGRPLVVNFGRNIDDPFLGKYGGPGDQSPLGSPLGFLGPGSPLANSMSLPASAAAAATYATHSQAHARYAAAAAQQAAVAQAAVAAVAAGGGSPLLSHDQMAAAVNAAAMHHHPSFAAHHAAAATAALAQARVHEYVNSVSAGYQGYAPSDALSPQPADLRKRRASPRPGSHQQGNNNNGGMGNMMMNMNMNMNMSMNNGGYASQSSAAAQAQAAATARFESKNQGIGMPTPSPTHYQSLANTGVTATAAPLPSPITISSPSSLMGGYGSLSSSLSSGASTPIVTATAAPLPSPIGMPSLSSLSSGSLMIASSSGSSGAGAKKKGGKQGKQ